jgi:hypothetical protein
MQGPCCTSGACDRVCHIPNAIDKELAKLLAAGLYYAYVTAKYTYPDIDKTCEKMFEEFDGKKTTCHYQCPGLGELCSHVDGSCPRTAFSISLHSCDD